MYLAINFSCTSTQYYNSCVVCQVHAVFKCVARQRACAATKMLDVSSYGQRGLELLPGNRFLDGETYGVVWEQDCQALQLRQT